MNTATTTPVAAGHSGSAKSLAKHILSGLRLILVPVLVWYLVHTGLLDPSVLLNLFSLSFLPTAGMIMLLMGFGHLMMAWRQQMLLNAMGIDMTLARSFSVIYIGAFFNNFLPSNSGGDVARVYFLWKGKAARLSGLAGLVLFDRVLGISSLALLAIPCLFHGANSPSGSSCSVWTDLWLAVCVGMSAPALLSVGGLLLRIGVIRRSVKRALSFMPPSHPVVEFCRTLEFFSQRGGVIAAGLAVGLFSHAAALLGVVVLARFMVGPESLVAAVSATPVVMILGAIPLTPGNVGSTEYFAGVLWNSLGQHGGATVFAAWRLMFMLFSVLGGVCYLLETQGMKSAVRTQTACLHRQ